VVAGEWRNYIMRGLDNLYSAANIIRAIKSRRIRWAVHVARTGERGVKGFDGEI
jgi:hypothetical protein